MSPTSKQVGRYLISVAIAVPPMFAIVASLWPLESIALFLACIVLGLATIVTFPFVRSYRLLFAEITSIAILLSVMTFNWPLHAAYVLSRPSFDRVAAEVRAGHPLEIPRRVGLFSIQKAEVYHNGVVCLWTDDDPAGPTGFVQHGAHDLPFNLWSHTRLDDSWQFIAED